MKRKIKIFVGYQIESEFHQLEKLKEAIETVKNIIEKEIDIYIDEIKYGDELTAGKFLFSEVYKAINECNIAIFDISENNPNVLIEVGLAYGTGNHVILLKNKDSESTYKVPSDISAFIYIPYKNKTDISSEKTCNKIAKAIVDYLKSAQVPEYYYFKAFWGFNETEEVYIVCPELPDSEKRQHPEPQEFLYLGKYGDLDSLVTIYTSLNKIYPKLNIQFCTSEEFRRLPGNPYVKNLVLIGGPNYNKITEIFMDYTPFKFEDINGDIVLIHKGKNTLYKSKFEMQKDHEKVIDYGFFLKMPNPNNPNAKLIMINGIHTYGVYGVAKCFSLGNNEDEKILAEKNCKIIVDNLGYNPNFAAIIKIFAIDKKVNVPHVDVNNLIKL